MKVRFTVTALRQLDRALAYIEERNPQGARVVKQRIEAIATLLPVHPLSGHATDRPGQRRLVASPYPYVIFYRVFEREVVVQRIRHAARRPAENGR